MMPIKNPQVNEQAANETLQQARILFLLPVVTDARYHKRIEALAALGTAVEVLAFERTYYPGKPKFDYTSLGKLSHGDYFRRLLPFVRALPVIRSYARSQDALYCFGLDTLLLAWFARWSLGQPLKLLYEVGDIREVLLGKGLKSKLARWLESFLVRKLDLLVLTSQAYYDNFYQAMLKLSPKYQIIENKLDKSIAASREPGSADYFMGYFGVLRCPRSFEIMQCLAAEGLSVYIRGYPRAPLELSEADLCKASQAQDHLDYGGTYLVPDELADVYGQVRLVWACYPYEGNRAVTNARWARTNRFYEACYFKKPMICQVGTEDARVVEKLNIGLVVDLAKPESVVEALKEITYEKVATWRENLNALPESTYLYSQEHEVLLDFLAEVR